MTNQSFPVYIISLADQDLRRSQMQEKMKHLGLDYEFLDAVDGRGQDVKQHPNYNGRARRLRAGRDLEGAEIGCFMSHKKAIEKMLSDGHEAAVILEDDVILTDYFPKAIEELLKIQNKWELVRFLGSPKVARLTQRKVAPLTDDHFLTRLKTTPSGAHAYLINKSGAEKLLKYMQKNVYPIDVLMGRSWQTGIEMLTIQPGIAVHDEEMESAIGQTRFDKSLQLEPWEKAVYPLTRAMYKLGESVGKNYSYYKSYFKDKAA